MKRKVIFRADASRKIGYGHFVRSLALADMLKDDFDCIFYTQEPTSYQREQVLDVCQLVELPAGESKFPLFLDVLNGDEIVVLDNFYYTLEYQQQIKAKGCKLVCMGGPDRQYAADLILSQAATDSSLFHSLPGTQYCLGLEWALLRRPFTQYIPKKRERVQPRSAVICFGGTDYNNLTGQTVDALCKDNLLDALDIIVGDVYEGHIDVRYTSKVTIHRNLSAQQIVNLFDKNDIAILASSSIAIEAMACRIPVIAGWWVDNQDAFYHLLERNKFILGLGYLLTDSFGDNLKKALFNVSSFDYSNPISNAKQIPSRFVKVFHNL